MCRAASPHSSLLRADDECEQENQGLYINPERHRNLPVSELPWLESSKSTGTMCHSMRVRPEVSLTRQSFRIP